MKVSRLVAKMSLVGLMIAFLGGTSVLWAQSQTWKQTESKTSKKMTSGSLYERVGGLDNIAILANNFITALVGQGRMSNEPGSMQMGGKQDMPGMTTPTTGTGTSGMGMESGMQQPSPTHMAHMTLLHYYVLSELCQSAGGPCKFTGTPTAADFAHMKLTTEQWYSAINTLRADIEAQGITGADRDKLVTAVDRLRSHIVVTNSTTPSGKGY
jgi:hypothetical protein